MNNPEIKNKKPLVEDFTQVDYNTKVLEVKNLKKHFFIGTGKKKLAVPAVDDVTFDVYKREVFGLVGESGCGKTTTGRTIIKLYNATEGSVVLNDIKISGGYLNHINEIAAIKKQLKIDIEELDPAKRQINQINAKTEIKVQSLEAEIQAKKAEHQAKLKEAKKSLEKYQDDVYELNNKFKLAVANEEYNANLAINEITMKTKNKAEIELINESKIAKKTYENKVDGMNDSAALNQDVIKSRLEDLKVEYEAKLAELEKTYRPLIENEAKNILPKDEAKKQIAKINADKKAKITAIKEKYATDKLNVTKPNKSFVNAKTKEINEAYNKIYANLKNEIKSVKAQAKTEIAALPKSSVQTDEYKAKKAELTQIANEKIKEHKAAIEEVKNVNSSKDTLQASQKMQMIFQDPISSLNPRMTVKEIIAEGLVIQKKYTMEEINERVAEVLQLVGLAPEYATRYPHEFSGGQRQRIGIARALIMNPNFIIADEPISALDVSIRAQVINLLTNLKEQLGLTVLFIAHDLSVVRFFCDRIAVMYAGKIVELAPAEELFRNPQHPYTKSLLSAIPQPDPDYEKGRSRIHYNPAEHNYKTDKPFMQEIVPGHLVYANKAEFELYKSNYGKKSNDKTPGNTK